jgi:hypothetical protein
LRLASATQNVAEQQNTLSFSVTRANGSSGAATVDYQTVQGSATAGADYQSAMGTLSWNDGQMGGRPFAVTLLPDVNVESNEAFTVSLINATGAVLGSPAATVVTIVDDDAAPQPGALAFSTDAYDVAESGGPATVGVSRLGGSSGEVTVRYAAVPGTASASDFTTVSGTLTFAAGATQSLFTVPILGDTSIEGDETIALSLMSPGGGATLGSQINATLRIVDDDFPSSAGALAFATGAVPVAEGAGAASVALRRTGGSAGAVSVVVSTADGSAVSPADYAAIAGQTVNWADGDTSEKTVTVSIVDDATVEGQEQFSLTLANATATVGTPNAVTVTVQDNDTAPVARGGGGGGGGALGMLSVGFLLLLHALARLRSGLAARELGRRARCVTQ